MEDQNMTPTYGERVLQKAISYLGVHEVGGNNHGPQVEKWLAGVHQAPGAPWCSAFVVGCGAEVAGEMEIPNPCPMTASALHLLENTPPSCHRTTPARGYWFVLEHASGGHHAGIVEDVNDDGTLDTVEGNTNGAGSRDGNQVARQTGWDAAGGARGRVLGYVDPNELLALKMAAPEVA